MNTERRKVARNAFEKDYFELMKNSIFGKTGKLSEVAMKSSWSPPKSE